MRRANREIFDKSTIRALMEEALVCRIGFCDDGLPYVVPMNFGLGENCLFLHCATEGRKLDILRQNDRVCFEMDFLREIRQGPASCGWGARYESVIGFGRAILVDDAAEKRFALDRIMDHYRAQGPYAYPDDILAKTAIIRIEIESLTGKCRE
ncbi:MAG: pyridoxamine 5'-phosphate oxidase family protein [Proteobacteria bacterium]|nr:pyridoxamine 5'-phosphate oxidase family protein [Pseudomonadota bacterium]MBU1743432.1 pyridoxamine 5'-phosphate oxidase family protein [Pseudomonadota bacterium]MBU4370889.1 pyridoxamine 5'-phosphate oxidase family protein [Pseudomonadota bacterium]MBU4582326.1 pyridoxamine 5'-phosphate oxidase family protein [Pseudomonadota bacterium]MCG2740690.1 pyridoxamine 5'-phosphate oxidase family protein [Syntrophaceae bacterium]